MKKYIYVITLLAILFFLKTTQIYGGDTMKATSTEFEHNQMIPAKFTCQGEDINPTLKIEDIPEGTKSLVLINDDPDAPMGTWDHWIVFNIATNGQELTIGENSVPAGTQGKNSWGRNDYGGPCPPSGTHRYFFKFYALDTTLDLQEGVKKKTIEQAMEGHILQEVELIGLYKKS